MKSISERNLQRPDGRELPFRLTRMRRKTLSIRISEEGVVDVRIPTSATLRETEFFLIEKLPWIDHQLTKAIPHALRSEIPEPQQQLLWRGQTLQIQYSTCAYPLVQQDHLQLPETLTSRQLKSWGKRAAAGVLQQRIEQVMEKFSTLDFQRMPSSWRLRWTRSRWGSCNRDGQINLNLRLAIFNDALIDAVIYHELCHLFVLNHGPKFYQLLVQLDPNYRQHSLQLRKLSQTPIAQLSWHWLSD